MTRTVASNEPPLVPAYYWAGPGSARVHRLKGFTFGIDEIAYREAYSAERLRWLKEAFGVDFAFLSYNWGLPPELEREDWTGFEAAAAAAHDLGMRVAAYVQPSNAVATGTYRKRDWYAITPKGKRIPYYNGRFFTCLNHPGWRAEVHSRVRGAIEAGADAIFLDNCAFGGMPIPLNRDYTAFAGCFCIRCQESFGDWLAARGLARRPVPELFRPGKDPVSQEFAHWRAWTLTAFIRDIRDAMRRIDPAVKLLTNTVGAVNVNTYNVFGVDLPALAEVVDWMFVENLQSPRSERGLLVQNAGTFKLLQALKEGAPTLSISYERGIGVDSVPGARTFERIMAEAYAAGGVPVVRAGEYIENRDWTLLQPGLHDDRARATRGVVDFVASHPELFRRRRPASPIAVYVPEGLAWRGDVFPEKGSNYLAVMQALVRAAIPFRVVTRLQDLGGLSVLIVPDGARLPERFSGEILRYDQLGLRNRRRSLFDYFVSERLLAKVGPWVVDGYYSRVYVRRFVDRLDLLFRLVFRDQFAPVDIDRRVAAWLRSRLPCTVESRGPVYADLWRTERGLHLHLVNYGDTPVEVDVHTAMGEPAEVVASDKGAARATQSRRVTVDNYAVVAIEAAATQPEPVEAPLVLR